MNIFRFECERCGQSVYATSIKECEDKLKIHMCAGMADYRSMPIEDFIKLCRERLRK